MLKSIILALVLTTLVGCASLETPLDDGYQFGDVTKTANVLQARYCDSADPYQRAVRMVLLQRAGVELPDEGACTDILELLSDADNN